MTIFNVPIDILYVIFKKVSVHLLAYFLNFFGWLFLNFKIFFNILAIKLSTSFYIWASTLKTTTKNFIWKNLYPTLFITSLVQ